MSAEPRVSLELICTCPTSASEARHVCNDDYSPSKRRDLTMKRNSLSPRVCGTKQASHAERQFGSLFAEPKSCSKWYNIKLAATMACRCAFCRYYLDFFSPIPYQSESSLHDPCSDLSLHQSSRPDQNCDAHIEEVEDEGSTEDDGIVGPCCGFGDRDLSDDYGPREDPEEVGA